jgi:glycosyltransferase involved in cell wall biosynthesis
MCGIACLINTNGPLISVVTANYNYARYIGQTIESVLAQTYPHVEHIVVDDGSTDNSLAVIARYPGIRSIAKPNGGQVSAMIEGMSAAQGDIVIFLDSDDTLHPDACARVAAAYDPAVTLYQFGLDIVDGDGNRIGSYPDHPLLAAKHTDFLLQHGAFPSSPTSGNAFSAQHVRRMLAEVGEDRRFFIDGYMIYSAPFFGAVKRIDATLGNYLVHGGNVSLSAGVDRRSAEKSLRNAIWQRTAITHALRLQGQPTQPSWEYLTAWHYRYLLILRRCYGVRDIVPELSDTAVASRAIARFLREPFIGTRQRTINLLLILALMAGDTRLGRKVVPA